MERYKIYQSLPEQGLYKNTKTNDTYIITVYPPVRIKNPTETAIKMLKDKAFERPTFIPSIDEINLELPNSVWITKHHKCVPIYYGYENAGLSIENLKNVLC